MMLRNMVTSLLDHEKIQTTVAKAKEVKRLADKVIVLAKKGDLHARRQAVAILTDKGVVRKLFSEVGPRFQNRAGGFTRVLKLGFRPGDGAALSVVMLTESVASEKPERKKTAKAASKTKKASQAKVQGKEEKPQKKGKRKTKKTPDEDQSSGEKSPPKLGARKKGEGPKKIEAGNQASSQ
jgi:large subunit ribosomal protein L17